MTTEKKTALAATIEKHDQKTEYDAECKILLAQKPVLAQILKQCVPEYRDIPLTDIEQRYIEGEPQVGTVPVMPDETNNPAIRGRNAENKTATEGVVFFDIVFDAIAPQDDSYIRLIVNVEGQRLDNKEYNIVTRGIYYACRLISSQKDRVFTGSDYHKIRKVYSIWVLMHSKMDERASIMAYDMQERALLGMAAQAPVAYDLLAIRVLYLHPEVAENPKGILHMLAVLLSNDVAANAKEELLADRYGLKMTEAMKNGVEKLCNLSEAIEERGIRKGIEQGIQQEQKSQAIKREKEEISRVLHMLRDNVPPDFIAKYSPFSLEHIQEIGQRNGLIMGN